MMRYSKQRGQHRKLKTLLAHIDQIEPYANITARYEHFHVPSDSFVSSPKTSRKVKTEFCRAWLYKTAEIIGQKPKELSFCKVIAVIDTGDLCASQIIIFYDEAYYNTFWKRDSTEQTWLPMKNSEKSLTKERNIQTSLNEKGYVEIVSDEDEQRKSILWFYGDVQ